MPALIDMLSSDLVLHVYTEWLCGFDAFAWQFACVFQCMRDDNDLPRMYPKFAQTESLLVALLRSVSHRFDQGAILGVQQHWCDRQFTGRTRWFETARIVPYTVSFAWYQNIERYPWMAMHAHNITLCLDEQEVLKLTHAIPTVSCLEIFTRNENTFAAVTIPACPWPNVRTLRWRAVRDSTARRFSMDSFPNVECMEFEHLREVTIDAFASATQLQRLTLSGTYIHIDAPCRLPQLRALVCNGVRNDWLQLDSLTSLRICETFKPVRALPNVTAFVCDASVVSEWLPGMSKLRQLTVVYRWNVFESVSLQGLHRLATCTLCIHEHVAFPQSVDALIRVWPHLTPWFTECQTDELYIWYRTNVLYKRVDDVFVCIRNR